MKKILFYFILALFVACEGPEGPEGAPGPAGPNGNNGNNGTPGLNSLIDMIDEPPGDNCPVGGVKIISGLDTNGNSVLETEEVTVTKYVCDGIGSLIVMTKFQTSDDCFTGGIKIQSGKDDNANGTLEESEVDLTEYVCNGGAEPREIRLATINALSAPSPDVPPPPLYVITLYNNFLKENYESYDKAVYSVETVFMYDDDVDHHDIDPEWKIILEIVDMTHGNTPIEGSQLIFGNGGPFESGNFFENLPDTKVKLGVSIKTNNEDFPGKIIGGSMTNLVFTLSKSDN